MKVIIERDALVKSLNHVVRVVEPRHTAIHLTHVCLTTSGDYLSLTATDGDIEMSDFTASRIDEEGGLTVLAKSLFDIVRKLPAGSEILLDNTSDNKTLLIEVGRAKFRLPALSAEDFPTMDAGKPSHEFTITCEDLKAIIDQVEFAISTEETRYYLNGIFLSNAEGSLRGVATDGHRLALYDIALPEGANGMPDIIIPRKTVAEIGRLCDADAEASIALSANKIRISIGNATLISKLIDGTFPDYRRVIPTKNEKTLSVSPAEFSKVVDRVSTISASKSKALKMTLRAEGEAVFEVQDTDGFATESINCTFDSDELAIGFSSKYLLDIAGKIKGKELQMKLDDSGSPALIRDPTEPAGLFVLMPMRV